MANFENVKGLSLKAISKVVIALTCIIVAAFIVLSVFVLTKYSEIKDSVKNYLGWERTATSLSEGSEYLTNQVRAFAVTGERQYLDNYFEEANVTRRRDHAVEVITEKFSGTEALEKLKAAMKKSVELMDREYYSMRLAASAFGYDLSTLPEVVSRINLTPEQLTMSADELHHIAQNMVFDSVYAEAKNVIETNIDGCIDDLILTAEENTSRSLSDLSAMLTVQAVLLALLVLSSLATAFIVTKTVSAPLISAVSSVKDGKKLSITGAHEFRFFAQAYNTILESNIEQKKLLTYEATHDNLTGVYNRRGFRSICDKAKFENYALLMIDIDNFKYINDMHGHDIGDRALRKLVLELCSVFHINAEVICRLGGDEFVVFLDRVEDGGGVRADIAEKVGVINRRLSNPVDNFPAMSISVGVAFGKRGADISDVHKSADRALYRVKENGKRDCAFGA